MEAHWVSLGGSNVCKYLYTEHWSEIWNLNKQKKMHNSLSITILESETLKTRKKGKNNLKQVIDF